MQAKVTHSEFYKNVGHFGGTFWVSDNSSVTCGNSIFRQNQALQGGVFMIHNNSQLAVFNTKFSKNQAKKFRDLPLKKNLQSHLNVQPILQKLLQQAESDFNTRKDGVAGGVVAASGSEVLLTSTSFVKNTTDGFGGALAVDSKFSIVSCTFSDNMARHGGAIGLLVRSKDVCSSFADGNYHSDTLGSDNTSLHIIESTFEQNRADENGGAIADWGYKTLDIQSSKFKLNQANEGGAIHLESFATINLHKSSFTQNVAHFRAGAVKLSSNSISHVKNCSFFNNSASIAGTVEIMDGNTMNMEHTLFQGNYGEQIAGVFYGQSMVMVQVKSTLFESNTEHYGNIFKLQRNSSLEIYNSDFIRNTIHTRSGVILLADNIISNITGSSFSENRGYAGAAIYAEYNVKLQIFECLFSSNSASTSGTIFMRQGIEAMIHSTKFISNTASQGGGMMVQGATKTFLRHCTFINNTAKAGGAIFGVFTTTFIISESSFYHNSATEYGGALSLYGGAKGDISACELTNNTAMWGGPIISARNAAINSQSSAFKSHTDCQWAASILGNNLSLQVENSTFTQNKADEAGGAIVIKYSTRGTFLDIYFGDNMAKEAGGAIFTSTNTIIQITMCHIRNSHAKEDDGVNAQENVDLQISGSNFKENHAETAGALFAHHSVNLCVTGTSFQQNIANTRGAEFTDIYGLYEGRAIYLARNVTSSISNTRFVSNTADIGAGISMFDHVHVSIKGSHFQTNYAKKEGGSISVSYRSHVEAMESSFTTNTAEKGGAIALSESTFTLISSDFASNTAHESGGTMYLIRNAIGNISWCNFTNNNALQAGVIYMSHNITIRIEYSHFQKNKATDCAGCLNQFYIDTRSGGCLYGYGMVDVSVCNSSFTENVADKGSVAYFKDRSSVNVFGSLFTSNKASEVGVISLSGQVNAAISQCNFQGNKAGLSGSVILAVNKADVEIYYSYFNKNSACQGGVLNIQKSKLTLLHSNFTNNTATCIGGAIMLIYGTRASISHTTFVGNTAFHGGTIYASTNCILNMENNNLAQNQAHHIGGAVNFDGAKGDAPVYSNIV